MIANLQNYFFFLNQSHFIVSFYFTILFSEVSGWDEKKKLQPLCT